MLQNDFCAQNALWRLEASITTPPTRRKLKVAHVFFYNFHINDYFMQNHIFTLSEKIQSCNATELLQKISRFGQNAQNVTIVSPNEGSRGQKSQKRKKCSFSHFWAQNAFLRPKVTFLQF